MFTKIRAELNSEWLKKDRKSIKCFEKFGVEVQYDDEQRPYISCDPNVFDEIKNNLDADISNENVADATLEAAPKINENISYFEADVWKFLLVKKHDKLEELKKKYNFLVTSNIQDRIATTVYIPKESGGNVPNKEEAIGIYDDGFSAFIQLYQETLNENVVEIYEDPLQKFLLNVEDKVHSIYPSVLIKRNKEAGGISIIGDPNEAKSAKVMYIKETTPKKLSSFFGRKEDPFLNIKTKPLSFRINDEEVLAPENFTLAKDSSKLRDTIDDMYDGPVEKNIYKDNIATSKNFTLVKDNRSKVKDNNKLRDTIDDNIYDDPDEEITIKEKIAVSKNVTLAKDNQSKVKDRSKLEDTVDDNIYDPFKLLNDDLIQTPSIPHKTIANNQPSKKMSDRAHPDSNKEKPPFELEVEDFKSEEELVSMNSQPNISLKHFKLDKEDYKIDEPISEETLSDDLTSISALVDFNFFSANSKMPAGTITASGISYDSKDLYKKALTNKTTGNKQKDINDADMSNDKRQKDINDADKIITSESSFPPRGIIDNKVGFGSEKLFAELEADDKNDKKKKDINDGDSSLKEENHVNTDKKEKLKFDSSDDEDGIDNDNDDDDDEYEYV